MIIVILILILVLLLLLASYWAYIRAFAADPKREAGPFDTPDGEQYRKYSEMMNYNVRKVLEAPCEDVYISSRDGVKLYGRYYHNADGAPLTILFHGYRSNAIRDVNGAYKVCRESGLNILTVDQRAHGKSGGRTITFGIKERFDCLDWIDYALNRFGKDTKITIMGVSMGAATVLMAAGEESLPKNVKGVASDCSYADQMGIIDFVIKLMKLPLRPARACVKMGARIFGGFDISSLTPLEQVGKIKIPVLFVHGEADRLIPCDMSREMYRACNSHKMLITVPEADHGMSYFVDNKTYETALRDFFLGVYNEEIK